MKVKKVDIFIWGCLVIASCVFICVAIKIKQIRYETNMSFLNGVIRGRLYNYYHKNGRYPAKLADLTEDIMEHGYPAKRRPVVLQMLDEFVYETDGIYYEITCDFLRGKTVKTRKEHAANGKMLFEERYQNSQLRIKFEYSEGKLVSITKYKDGKVISEETVTDGQVIEK